MSPRRGKKCRFQVEALEGRIALSSNVPISGPGGVSPVPAVVAPDGGAASEPTLQSGDHGPAVTVLQQDLKTLGYVAVGTADGDFGAHTEQSVTDFQADKHLKSVDGIVGPETWSALDKALKEANPGGGQLSVRQIEEQLDLGFRDAHRPDLAQKVYTANFHLWIQTESGWNPRAVSPPDNHGLRNDGLFQIWRGHSFNRNGEVSRMTPYQQAQTVARYFPQLTPQKIDQYAAEIRAGTYKGWG